MILMKLRKILKIICNAKIFARHEYLIWIAEQPQKLSKKSESVLDSDNELLLSHVSVWEMAIKIKTEKLKLKMQLEEFITKAIEKHKLDFCIFHSIIFIKPKHFLFIIVTLLTDY